MKPVQQGVAGTCLSFGRSASTPFWVLCAASASSSDISRELRACQLLLPSEAGWKVVLATCFKRGEEEAAEEEDGFVAGAVSLSSRPCCVGDYECT